MLSSSTIKRLADDGRGLRVSLYLPTHRAGSETAQDPIRLKNLLTRAAAELEEVGARSTEIDAMLKPARALLDDVEFWAHQADGLAVLLAGGDLEALRLPLTVDELAVVADRFHLKPLLPLLSGDGRFHVLALSQNQVRLFEGSREAIREVDLRDIPQSLRDVVGYDWDESSLQFHTGTSRGMGGRPAAMFHGDGSPKDEAKPEIAAFLRVVDDGITHLLGPVDVPVVLAAVEYVASIYRQITKLPRVMAEVVEGSPDRVPLTELHARAWGIVAPGFSAERDAAAERFRSLTSTDLATTDLASTVARAMEGRIDTLFIAVGVRAWGRPRTAHRDLEIHPERQPGDRDLFDVAAVHALLTDARVYAVSPELMPVADEAIAAILRY